MAYTKPQQRKKEENLTTHVSLLRADVPGRIACIVDGYQFEILSYRCVLSQIKILITLWPREAYVIHHTFAIICPKLICFAMNLDVENSFQL